MNESPFACDQDIWNWLIGITGLPVGENGQHCAGFALHGKNLKTKINQSGKSLDPVRLPPKNGKIGERPTRCGNSLQPPNSSPSYSTGPQQQKPPSHQPQKPNQFFNKNNLNCDPNNNIAVEAEPIGGHWWTQPLGGHAKHFVCKHSSP